jgi:hypothetical protein
MKHQLKNRYDRIDTTLYNNSFDNVGEITGEKISSNDYDKKLPLRSNYHIKKAVYDANEYDDFTRMTNINKNVNYYDPLLNTKNNDYSDITNSMKKLSTYVEPINSCSSAIENITFKLYNEQNKNINNTVINGYSIYIIFASLYNYSVDITEIDLHNYFDFSKKDYIYKGITQINDILKNHNFFNSKNIMLIGNNVPYSSKKLAEISEFIYPLIVDINNSTKEAIRVNNTINNLLDANVKKSVIPKNIENLQLMLMNVSIIEPKWIDYFDTIYDGYFNETIEMKYLYGLCKEYEYYENSKMQILELTNENDILSFGFIISNNDYKININEQEIKYNITQLKKCIMDKVKIPIFTKNYKIRLSSLINDTGLTSVFVKIMLPQIFPENTVVHDITQNITINIPHKIYSTNKKNKKNTYKSNRSFICNKSFVFYIKFKQTDTLLFLCQI